MTHSSDVPPCVVVAHDDGYAPHSAVTLLSVLDHTPNARLFALVPSTFRQEDAMKATVGPALTVIRLDESRFATLKRWAGGSLAAYLRLSVGDVLPIPRVIYLDSDIVVRTDLTPLWSVDLGDNIIAAVPDVAFADRARLGLTPDEPYFNSGVAVIDLDRWRSQAVGDRVVIWARENPDRLTWADQCALNWVLRGQWLALDPMWNMQAPQFGHDTKWGFRFDRRRSGNPAIVHFTAPHGHGRYADSEGKPWAYLCEHPWRDAYRRIAVRTPWTNSPMSDRYPHNMALRLLRQNADWALPAYRALRRVI